jgi:hypothetical protein
VVSECQVDYTARTDSKEKKVKRFFMVLVLCAVVVAWGFAFEGFRVTVAIGVSDEEDYSNTRSFINRELRSLGDVTVWPSLPLYDSGFIDWQVRVTVWKDPFGSGYFISTLYLKKTGIFPALQDELRKDNDPISNMMADELDDAYIVADDAGSRSAAGTLRQACELMVTEFDKYLDQWRDDMPRGNGS